PASGKTPLEEIITPSHQILTFAEQLFIMDAQLLQYIGYVASGIIAFSMTMNSIVKFRWINLLGASSFAIYGFLIGAYPVMLLNGFIVLVDIYYLIKIYSKSQLFDTLQIKANNQYLLKFLEYNKKDIQKYFPGFEYKAEKNTISFFVLRNMAVTGIFLAHREDNNILKVGLDYVIPEYRDFKNGKYVYHHLNKYFKKVGFERIITTAGTPVHEKYLKKLGFKETKEGLFEKSI
ncbi:MAG: YgjV family protein, partial [Chlorobi bacterium]|nr:YgjV family protein [Chlorobiota bacterium]